MELQPILGTFWISRLPADAHVPGPAEAAFFSVKRTADELSIVGSEPIAGARTEGPWHAFRIAGILDFSLTGVLQELTGPLADAGVSVFVVSTFDTDYILVRSERSSAAVHAWRRAGYTVTETEVSEHLAVVQAILDGYRTHVGGELIERTDDSAVNAQRLFDLDAVVLSHDGGADPRFVYANLAAAQLWRMDVDELVGMPSRLSAPPNHRDERQAMLQQAATDGVLHGYAGTRVAKDGTLFVIEDATLWTVDYPHGRGQAVVFRSWHDN